MLVTANVPGGILLEPNSGLAINDFTGGVDFFKTLPDIDSADQLTGPAFALPGAISVDQWLDSVQGQVVNQFLAIKSGQAQSGFAAAFSSPMTIFGSAKLFSIYTSELVFNGQVAIKISTDGKILVIGQLNFAADNLSLSARLYANLTNIAKGEGTILILVKVPDQIDLLTIKGSLKFGFRDILGEEVEFGVTYQSLDDPYQVITGIPDGATFGIGAFGRTGYVDIALPSGDLTGDIIQSSVTDLESEIIILSGGRINTAIGAALVDETTNTYRFWLSDLDPNALSITYRFAYQTWAHEGATAGSVEFSEQGKDENASLPATAVLAAFVDVQLVPQIDTDLQLRSAQPVPQMALMERALIRLAMMARS